MAFKGDFKAENQKDFVRRNEQIRVPQVLVIENGRNIGVLPTYAALAKARDVGLDLVKVSAESVPPVCQIMDYGKVMFDKQKKEKDKVHNTHKEKEISFRYVIDENAFPKITNYLSKLQTKPNFANGRAVRNLFEEMVTRQAERLAQNNNIDEADLSIILSSDVPNDDEIEEGYLPAGYI